MRDDDSHPADSAVYDREPDVIWRLGVDRVLVHRVNPVDGWDQAADLTGLAAAVWVSLDEDGTLGDLVDRISEELPVERTDVADAVRQLRDAHWITTASG